jgi:hypothetical protein
MPTTSWVVPTPLLPSSSSVEKISAPRMIGRLIRNEKRAAASRSSPIRRPAVMVPPDRETPGAKASAWPAPIAIACRAVISRYGVRCGARRSTA